MANSCKPTGITGGWLLCYYLFPSTFSVKQTTKKQQLKNNCILTVPSTQKYKGCFEEPVMLS